MSETKQIPYEPMLLCEGCPCLVYNPKVGKPCVAEIQRLQEAEASAMALVLSHEGHIAALKAEVQVQADKLQGKDDAIAELRGEVERLNFELNQPGGLTDRARQECMAYAAEEKARADGLADRENSMLAETRDANLSAMRWRTRAERAESALAALRSRMDDPGKVSRAHDELQHQLANLEEMGELDGMDAIVKILAAADAEPKEQETK